MKTRMLLVSARPMPLTANRRSQRGSLVALLPPVHAHAELRQREGQEHVDAVEHDQRADVAARCRAAPPSAADAHEQDAVLGHQAVAQLVEAVRHPRVDRHVGEHARAVEEARLGRDEEQRALADQRDEQEPLTDLQPADVPAAGDALDQDRVQRPAGLVLDAEQQVREQDAAGGERERHRHVEHGALAGRDPRLAQDLQAVRDRLDAGVGAAAEAVGAQERDGDRARSRARPISLPCSRARRSATIGGSSCAWLDDARPRSRSRA